MLKCQFHTHVKGDLLDKIPHSAKQLIDQAAAYNYNVLAITSHKKLIFDEELKLYAENKGILLIPGIELEINKSHILAINCDNEIEKIDSFELLRFYKNSHPNSLIIAPHPFFPWKISLKKALIENIDLFDAIEYSFCYTKTKNHNLPAVEIAEKFNKPMIAASDCHILKYLDLAHTFIDAEKNPNSIIEAIKNNKIQRIHRPISYWKISEIIGRQMLRNIFNR